ncbi:MAG: DUF1284 domain-containing protein [Dehalococcoidia bacterium]|nr:DUF1284 domain-containing protein [Chloroflexota bacterium]MCK4242687.1 DUF1284 domain-containing protein [Dehalococcoidia bacterium]
MKLRAHHLICLLGFRGLGYSPEFVENMAHIADQLRSFPQTVIEVLRQPDDICSPCPFLGKKGCQDKGPNSEGKRRNRDEAVMDRLNVTAGDKLSWFEIRERMRSSINPEDLDEICQDCEWLPQGYCVEGLKDLRS